MISPADIRKKANRLYDDAVQAWLVGDQGFFPYRMKAKLSVPKQTPQPVLIEWVEALRAASKEALGHGFTVQYEQINRRIHGDNRYPQSIMFESFEDLLRLSRKQSEFNTLRTIVERVRCRLPQLDAWLMEKRNWKRCLAAAPAIDELLLVAEFVRDRPRPDCYLRELPLPVSTKVIEQNQSLLREWLDRILPHSAIDFGCDPNNFVQRFGFRYPRQHLLVRVLDPDLQHALGLGWREFSLPADDIAGWSPPAMQVFIVENKTNLLTLPLIAGGIAFGGLGNNLREYEKIGWLADQSIFYWGDLDVDGLLILGRLRRALPQTQSLLMDVATLQQHASVCIERRGILPREQPTNLLPPELAAFELCYQQRLRLEQEHIPQRSVELALQQRVSGKS